MPDPSRIREIADELFAADRDRTTVPLLTARNPGMTVEDAYAVQREWAERRMSAGARLVGRKIGLTSKVMQAATGITEPDYGVILDDMVYESGTVVEFDRFSNVRIEVELAFVLAKPLTGPGTTIFDVLDATAYVVPALEILLFGGPNQTYGVYLNDGAIAPATTNPGGSISIARTLQPGLNTLCAVVRVDLTVFPAEAQTCRTIAYVP